MRFKRVAWLAVAPLGWRRFAVTSVMPEAKSTNERIGLVAFAATRWKPLQLADVATAQHHVLGLEGGDQARDHVRDIVAPFLFAVALESATADIILKGCFPVRKVAQIHRRDDAIHN